MRGVGYARGRICEGRICEGLLYHVHVLNIYKTTSLRVNFTDTGISRQVTMLCTVVEWCGCSIMKVNQNTLQWEFHKQSK